MNFPFIIAIKRLAILAALIVIVLTALFASLQSFTIAGVLLAMGQALIVTAVIVMLGVIWFVRRPWPQINGTLSVTGLLSPVRIVRDASGIPHIYADNEHDLFFAQGYTHAQDRLWQMEFNRRIGRGTLSEALGKPTLENDRFLRTIGLRRAAEYTWTCIDTETRTILEAFAKGVNTYVAANSHRLPLEFAILGIQPEPWTPIDTLLWGEQMSWILGDNCGAELLRAKLIAVAGEEAAQQLMPPYPHNMPSIVPDGVNGYSWLRNKTIKQWDLTEDLFGGPSSNQGSNNWVVHGTRTASNKPLLANDTHLYLQMPSIWYENGLHGGRFDVVGFTIPGVPMIVIGHNGTIAWGLTDMLPDVQDLYIEKLDDPITPTRYEYQNEWHDLEIIDDTISVRGVGQTPLRILKTHHGPIINQVSKGMVHAVRGVDEMEPLALCWTGTEGSTIVQALYHINLASGWDDFRTALRSWNSPGMNMVYADVMGNIGYQSSGKIPIRASNHTGLVPTCGWTGENEWQGYIPFDDLPYMLNPSEGFIATANNKVVTDDYPYHLAYEWSDPFRIQRITDILNSNDCMDISDTCDLQIDTFSVAAERIRPYLLNITPQNTIQTRALALVESWNLYSEADQPGASIYTVWYWFMVQNIWRDKLGQQLTQSYMHYYWLHGRMILQLLEQPESQWFNDSTTTQVETRDDIIRRSLEEALAWLGERYGNDPQKWQWGRVHTMTFVHRPLGRVPIWLFKRLFNSKTFPVGGDDFSVNASWMRESRTFTMAGGTAQRLIVDLNNLDNSWAVNSTGQSGHALHPQRDDQTDLWRHGKYHPLLYSQKAVEQQASAILNLTPKAHSQGS
ncbi:MAG: penicillin acylase family protein [Chloroflexota bacterium]